jgi:hypothetical protein
MAAVILPFARPVVHELSRAEAKVQHDRVQAAVLSNCNERQARIDAQQAAICTGYGR